MSLPAELWPPLSAALARPAAAIPATSSLPGGARYEPKWDGFRLLIFAADEITLWSRRGKDLTRSFPDLAAAAAQLPAGIVLDGEAVVWNSGRLDFDALLRRSNAGVAALTRMAHDLPASYVAFDVLAVAGRDTRALRLDDRRALLEEVARSWSPPLNLSPVTSDHAEASQWFDTLVQAGIEGLIVKGGAQPYRGGERDWLKVKHRDTLDVICGAVIGPRERPQELVLGLPVGGVLRIVGRTSPLPTEAARKLGKILQSPVTPHPWPEQVKPGAVDRFNRSGRDLLKFTLVQPVVVEVSADVAMTGHSFRHAVRYLRARPEIPPAEISD